MNQNASIGGFSPGLKIPETKFDTMSAISNFSLPEFRNDLELEKRELSSKLERSVFDCNALQRK